MFICTINVVQFNSLTFSHGTIVHTAIVAIVSKIKVIYHKTTLSALESTANCEDRKSQLVIPEAKKAATDKSKQSQKAKKMKCLKKNRKKNKEIRPKKNGRIS